jgi:MFS transporter, MCT family, solute carrier family 16 (monocarboxylic acid transporters), member 14
LISNFDQILILFFCWYFKGIGFGLVYVPAIVCVGYYFDKYRSLAIGIAVCGAGVGTSVLSPLNRFLLDKYGWQDDFLIKAAIILNIIVCGLVMIPVEIEPSEIRRRARELEKKEKKAIKVNTSDKAPPTIAMTKIDEFNDTKTSDKMSIKSELNDAIVPTILVTDDEDVKGVEREVFLQVPLNKNRKSIGHSMPNINHLHNHTAHYVENMYSSMGMMAQIRSSHNIHISCKSVSVSMESLKKKHKLIDLHIFADFFFVVFAISNFLTSLGYNIPFIYIVDQANQLNIESQKSDMLLAIIGISNTIGRIILGLISDIKYINRLYLYIFVLLICGIATIVEPILTTFTYLAVYAFVFGFTSGKI